MSRVKWKGPFMDKCVFKKNIKKSWLKIWSRRSVISASFIGKTVLVYSGKVFRKIFITREKVGFKFGEFCLTRTRIPKNYKKKKK